MFFHIGHFQFTAGKVIKKTNQLRDFVCIKKLDTIYFLASDKLFFSLKKHYARYGLIFQTVAQSILHVRYVS